MDQVWGSQEKLSRIFHQKAIPVPAPNPLVRARPLIKSHEDLEPQRLCILGHIIFSTAAELSTESTNIRILILRRLTRAASCSLSLSLSVSLSAFLHDPSYSLLLSRRFCKGVLQEGLQHCLESSCSGSAPASSIRFLHPGNDPKMTKIISVYCCQVVVQ